MNQSPIKHISSVCVSCAVEIVFGFLNFEVKYNFVNQKCKTLFRLYLAEQTEKLSTLC